MAIEGNDGNVGFQSESGNIDFQPETGAQQQQAGITERIGEAAQAVNWGKVGVGVGAAAAVAGAAYAASKLVGRGESGTSGETRSQDRNRDDASGGGSGRS
ncbi:MAG TPA: hypothetical protein VEZ20_11055 [Allosphingosinicella sp.]|nr:hypothetical protein [Allosphingosinicella sp.]